MNLKKTKILFFIETLTCGGAEKSIVSLLQMLDYSVLDVDLLLLSEKKDTDFFLPYLPKTVNILQFPKPKNWRRPLSSLCNIIYSAFWRCIKLVRAKRHNAELSWTINGFYYQPLEERYDVAIAYQQGLPTYYIASKVKAKKKFAWINIDLDGAGYRASFNKKYYDKFDGVVAVSKQLYMTLKDSDYIDFSRLNVIYDILNVNLIRKMAVEKISTPHFKDGCLKLLTVGRLSLQKNYILAVDTAKELKYRGIKFHWIFVGDGIERSNIENRITEYNLVDCITLVGAQQNPYSFMQQADLYVHTASFEGFGLTIAEAKILGKPIVSTNFRIVYDQITDGVNGLIADMDPTSLANRIMLLVDDKILCDKIINNIRTERNDSAKTEVKKFYNLIGME